MILKSQLRFIYLLCVVCTFYLGFFILIASSFYIYCIIFFILVASSFLYLLHHLFISVASSFYIYCIIFLIYLLHHLFLYLLHHLFISIASSFYTYCIIFFFIPVASPVRGTVCKNTFYLSFIRRGYK